MACPFVLLFVVLIASRAAAVSPTAASAHVLTPTIEETLNIEKKGDARVYTCRLSKGQFVEISIRQTEGLLEVVLTGPNGKEGVPHDYDAGKSSVIRVPVMADEGGEYTVRATLRVPQPGGMGAISVTPPHP